MKFTFRSRGITTRKKSTYNSQTAKVHWSIIKQVKEAIQEDNQNNELYFRLAKRYHRLAAQEESDYFKFTFCNKAIDAYSQAITLAPHQADYYARRAACYILQDSIDNQQLALQDYSRACELAPNNVHYLHHKDSLVLAIAKESAKLSNHRSQDSNTLSYINVSPGTTYQDLTKRLSLIADTKQDIQKLQHDYNKETRKGFGWAMAARVTLIAAIAGAIAGAVATPFAFAITAVLIPLCCIATLNALESSKKRQLVTKKIQTKGKQVFQLEGVTLGKKQENRPIPQQDECLWERQESISTFSTASNQNHLLHHSSSPMHRSVEENAQETDNHLEENYFARASCS